jgi:hypothetical protein
LKTYRIEQGDTLETIARKLGVSSIELKSFHNTHCDLKDLLGGNDLPKHLNEILIDDNWEIKENESIEESNEEIIEFDQQARYRCEQINTTKVNGNLVQYLEQKLQYLLKFNLSKKIGYVKQEDYFKKLSPPILNNVFDFIEQTEKIRHDVHIKINPDNGLIEDVINKDEVKKNWENFKEKNAMSIPFLSELNKSNEKAFNDLMKMGDTQFSFQSNYKDEYQKDFFYQSCFDQYLYKEKFETISIDFLSTIVPPIVIPIKIRYDKVSENNGIVTLRKIAEYELNKEQKDEIIQKYNELHKISIGYSFTDYKLILRSKLEYDSETKILINGQISMKESILDNIENECNYQIKKLENHTPK